MDDEESRKLQEIARKLFSMTFILNGYCENFDGVIEVSNIIEFTEVLHKTSRELFDLV